MVQFDEPGRLAKVLLPQRVHAEAPVSCENDPTGQAMVLESPVWGQ